MNNEIKVFSNEEFGSVRRVEIDGDYWLVGKLTRKPQSFFTSFPAKR